MPEQRTAIYLVDDHTVVRNGLKSLIEQMGPYYISEEFANGKELIDALPFDKEPPDLIILDLTMPVMDGTATVAWLYEHQINYPVLVLTLDTKEETIIQLFRQGIKGYLPKACTAPTLKNAIDTILKTGFFYNEIFADALAGAEAKESAREKVLKKITARELEFLRLVCHEEEYTYKMIADIMKVQPRTVDGYRESLFLKFDLKAKTGLILFAFKHQLL